MKFMIEYLGETSLQLDFLEYYNEKSTEIIQLQFKDSKSSSISVKLAYRRM